MRGAMYTEVWVPRQVRSSEPDRDLPRQRPDRRGLAADARRPRGLGVLPGRAGLRRLHGGLPGARTFRVRAAAGPDGKTPIDGNLEIRTALELERIWTNARERGDFPLKMNHTQWPGTGKMGDPIFDNFIKTQVQFAGASTAAGASTPASRCST